MGELWRRFACGSRHGLHGAITSLMFGAVFYEQAGARVRCEWGEAAVRQVAVRAEAVVIVDVLSFSTSVDVAVARGACVHPHPSKDGTADERAWALGAIAASLRATSHGFSLSPSSLETLPWGARLVLPSPNGATLSEVASTTSSRVFCACLRNASAVAAHLATFASVLLVAAGERWPDGTLRPALEDWIGCGAIIDAMAGPLSAEARAARDAFRSARPALASTLQDCASGRELAERGFDDDITLAAAHDASRAVPVLVEGAYRDLGA